MYESETSKVRHLVLPFIQSRHKIADVGFGGDKIVPTAVGIDLPNPYAQTGHDQVDIHCDIQEGIPVDDDTFDVTYTSHLIEDFIDTASILRELIRITKDRGLLILVFPDQQVYEKHCQEHNQPLNLYHVHKNFGLSFLENIFKKIPEVRFKQLYTSNCEIDYNVVMVIRIKK